MEMERSSAQAPPSEEVRDSVKVSLCLENTLKLNNFSTLNLFNIFLHLCYSTIKSAFTGGGLWITFIHNLRFQKILSKVSCTCMTKGFTPLKVVWFVSAVKAPGPTTTGALGKWEHSKPPKRPADQKRFLVSVFSYIQREDCFWDHSFPLVSSPSVCDCFSFPTSLVNAVVLLVWFCVLCSSIGAMSNLACKSV